MKSTLVALLVCFVGVCFGRLLIHFFGVDGALASLFGTLTYIEFRRVG